MTLSGGAGEFYVARLDDQFVAGERGTVDNHGELAEAAGETTVGGMANDCAEINVDAG